jgi:ATP-dependent Clp protease adaptor protein ClpS
MATPAATGRGANGRGATELAHCGLLRSRYFPWIGNSTRFAMSQTVVTPRVKGKTKPAPKTQRPKLYKVILINDDFTPREFVVVVLKTVFRMGEEKAYAVMLTAHRRGVCVIAVFTRDVAETKAKEATDLGRQKGYPLFFTTEPEE